MGAKGRRGGNPIHLLKGRIAIFFGEVSLWEKDANRNSRRGVGRKNRFICNRGGGTASAKNGHVRGGEKKKKKKIGGVSLGTGMRRAGRLEDCVSEGYFDRSTHRPKGPRQKRLGKKGEAGKNHKGFPILVLGWARKTALEEKTKKHKKEVMNKAENNDGET